jgi:universal stress protein E
VRRESWPAQPAITVGADPCHPADRPETLDSDLVTLGSLFANALGGNLSVLHVLQCPPHLPDEAMSAIDIARAHGRAREAVERIVNGASNCAAQVPIRFVEGRVAETIIGFAAENRPHLMVLGASARPRWAYANASGTAAEVLDSLACDLLIAKPSGFVSPLLVTD